jgi:hypothetical protein
VKLFVSESGEVENVEVISGHLICGGVSNPRPGVYVRVEDEVRKWAAEGRL